MPRPPRIDYENAFHHIMNRGVARQPVFFQDSDRDLFLKCLELACEATHIESTPEDWPWSSSKDYSAADTGPGWLQAGTILKLFNSRAKGGDYQSFLREGIEEVLPFSQVGR